MWSCLWKKKSNWRFGALNLNVAVKFEKGAGNQRQLEEEKKKQTNRRLGL